MVEQVEQSFSAKAIVQVSNIERMVLLLVLFFFFLARVQRLSEKFVSQELSSAGCGIW